ncbi:MAG: glycosyltransferase, partial [Chitinivibrionales bacterium]|nr:glycosyltransferase [Chitinivibrionales bacterium]
PIRLFDSNFNSQIDLTPKQQALETGIAAASGDFIAFTDADMVLFPPWLSTLMQTATNGADFVFGHTAIRRTNSSLLEWLQAYQLESLMSSAFSFSRAGFAGSCMGNNILFSKKAYSAIGGHKALGRSIVEDCDLLRFFAKKKYCVAAAEPFFPTAETFACNTYGAYYHQALRWARGGFKPGTRLFFAGLLLGLQNVVFTLALAGCFNNAVALMSIVNSVFIIVFMGIGFYKTRSKVAIQYIPLFYAFVVLQTWIMGVALLLSRKVNWKNRKV